MTILEKIKGDRIQAMKDKNAYIKSVTQILGAKFKNEEIAQKRELAEDELLSIVRKELKQTEESFSDAQKAAKDTAEYEAQIAYLTALLPAAMSEEEVFQRVEKIAKGVEKQNKGDIMKAVMAELKGKADGKVIAQAVDSYLNGGC